MKKLLALLLALVMVLSFAACGSEDDDDDSRSSRRSRKDKTSQEDPQEPVSAGYEAAIKRIVNVMSCDISKNELKKMFPQECWDYFEEEEDMTLDDCYDMISESLKEQKEDLEDEFGKDFEVSYKILGKNDVPEDEMDEFKGIVDEMYGIKASAIGDCYEIELELTISGTEEETDEDSWHVVEIDGVWYIAEILIEGF